MHITARNALHNFRRVPRNFGFRLTPIMAAPNKAKTPAELPTKGDPQLMTENNSDPVITPAK